jgi:hypothetical protein
MLAIKLPMVMYGPIKIKKGAVDGLEWVHWGCLMELLKVLNGPRKAA